MERMMDIEQIKAIESLERAFKKCKLANLQFCGMDSDLHWATTEAVDGTAEGVEDYGPVARAIQNSKFEDETGKVDTHETYDDSGGW